MTQYDLPPQALLQQSAAHSLSGEELETYGKHASALYGCGTCASLNDAVVATVKQAGLSPEQVRRVCEFANTDAFVREFKKEGTASKYVNFDGGPASFSEVLKDLNDGGGGTVFDRGMADYAQAPVAVKTSAARLLQQNRSSLEKTAGVTIEEPENPADAVLAEAFAVDKTASPIPFHRPLQDVEDLQDKLATARDTTTSEMSSLETLLLDVTEELYGHIKQASLEGVPLGHVVQAWHQTLAPNADLVKSAFAQLSPRLMDDGLFNTWDSLGASIEKTAGVGLVLNEDHPIVQSFGAYCEVVTKLAEIRAAREELMDGIDQLSAFSTAVHQHYAEHV